MRCVNNSLVWLMLVLIPKFVHGQGKLQASVYGIVGSSSISYSNTKISSFTYQNTIAFAEIGANLRFRRWNNIVSLQYMKGELLHTFESNSFNPSASLDYQRWLISNHLLYHLYHEGSRFEPKMGVGIKSQLRSDKIDVAQNSFEHSQLFASFRSTFDLSLSFKMKYFTLFVNSYYGLYGTTNEAKWNAYRSTKSDQQFHILTPKDIDWLIHIGMNWKLGPKYSLPIGLYFENINPQNQMYECSTVKQLYIGFCF